MGDGVGAMAPPDEESTVVAGHRIRLTHLDKVLYPAAGVVKRDVIDYYEAVAAVMLPHVVERPVTRKRWPNGVGSAPFFEKALGAGVPSWVPRRAVTHSDRTVRYPLLDSPAGLVWMAQLAALELHVPQWTFDARGGRRNPDRLVIDLDPGPGAGLAECARVACVIRETLGRFGSQLVPVTSGSKGLHLYLGIGETMTSVEASDWARRLAELVRASLPEMVVTRMSKSERAGRVFIDWSQNNAAKTTVAPYSLRGTPQPMVAAPRLWEEIEAGDLGQLDFRQVLRRIEELGDPMAALGRDVGGADSAPASDDPARDRLDTYRAKRTVGRTPEPIPDTSPSGESDGSPAFVVQEHHARRLHWDFRLERDGVLASWAVPRGIPAPGEGNRLAVQTEDHPLEYASFAGTIPKGEYGAGEVMLWDSGHYIAEKWTDDEIVVVLLGAQTRGRYALIRTGGDQWLMHAMRDQSRVPAGPLPRDLAPMLATPGDLRDVAGDGWQIEGKWDGVRAVVEVDAGNVRAHSRAGRDITSTYPELGELATPLADHRAVLDGEIVALDRDDAPSFALLQRRMGLTRPSDVRGAMRSTHAHFFAFDLLYLDGVLLLDRPLAVRRQLLERLSVDTEHCRVPDLLTGSPTEALEESRRRRLEGIVVKRVESRYLPGQRPRSWVKVKLRATQDVVIVGWRPGRGARDGGIGSLLVALPDPHGAGLIYAGRVGTGFDQAALSELAGLLKPLRRKTSPVATSVPAADARDAVWVTPRLVGEVTFAEWTAEGRLRQPSWRGLRREMRIDQVRRES